MIRLTATALLAAAPALADAPSVLVDTPALHSITARVMDGAGTPALLLPPGASPHDFALRPSDAAVISDSELIFWVGAGLTPWLEAPLATLGANAQTIALLDSDDWPALPLRGWEDGHDHGEGHDDDDDHDHEEDHADDHDDHDEDHADDHEDDHADEHADDHDHDHEEDHADAHDNADDDAHAHIASTPDPHAWLDPSVAAAWGQTIAAALAEADPDNAETYRMNATAFEAETAALTAELTARLAPLAGRNYIVPHDAFQYFEARFGLPASGTITLSDAQSPAPSALADLRSRVQSGDIRCILTDPQTNDDWAALVAEGTGIPLIPADAEGVALTPGAALYPALISGLADTLGACLGPA